MPDSWLCDAGLRVTDLARSLRFYHSLLDLDELKREESPEQAYVLLRDRRSGQRLELNWYSEASPFWSPYAPGEGLDHLEVRVRDLPQFLERLAALGIRPVNRTLWTNGPVVERLRGDPASRAELELEVWTTDSGHRIAYVADPDGNLLCLYDHPEEPWDGPIPDHY
jgi:catechol 2,3-dioxygenase-like lactoylglutathione lyase family enzyme